MKVLGYTVSDIKLIVDGKGQMIQADRPCDKCLGSNAKIVRMSLDGYPAPWKEVRICKRCLVNGGLFLSVDDLDEELAEMTGGRGRG